MASPFTVVVLYPVSWISGWLCMLENWLFRGILLQYKSVMFLFVFCLYLFC